MVHRELSTTIICTVGNVHHIFHFLSSLFSALFVLICLFSFYRKDG